jgi:hypothetical protein
MMRKMQGSLVTPDLTLGFHGASTAVKKTPRTFIQGVFIYSVVGRAGVEPTTNGLKVGLNSYFSLLI